MNEHQADELIAQVRCIGLALFVIALAMIGLSLHALVTNADAAPPADVTPDLRCIRLFGCWYVPYSYVVTYENSQYVWTPYGTVLGIGEWRMLWDRTEWVEVR